MRRVATSERERVENNNNNKTFKDPNYYIL